MTQKKITAKSVSKNYAAIQGTYWMSAVPYVMFAVVFLQYRGLTNTQIGFAMSASAIGAIITQMLLSDFSDKNQSIPLKKIIALIYAVVVLMSAVLSFIPYPIAIIMTAYIVGQTCISSMNSLLSAQFMQLQNAGLSINYGFSRGIGSVLFAVTAFFMGRAVERFSPEILFPIQVGLSLLAVTFILIIPRPEKISGVHPDRVAGENNTSILVMLKENPTFIVLMFAMALTFIGQSYIGFMINLLEGIGGNTASLGYTFSLYALVEFLPMFFSAKLLEKFGAKKLLVIAVIAYLVKTVWLMFATNISVIYLISVTNIFGNGFYFFASVYFVNEIVKPNQRTRGQAFMGLCTRSGIATVVGASVCGVLLDRFGVDAMMIFCTACTAAGVVLIFVTAFLHRKHFVQLSN